MKLVLDGIYDKRSFQFANTHAKGIYGFDFRPRSFNFVQAYVVEELLADSLFNENDIIELHFENDSEIIVNSIVSQVANHHSNIRLNFGTSSIHQKSYLESFGKAFSVIFDAKDSNAYHKVLSPLCQSVVFDYEFLHDLSATGQLDRFIINFYSKVMKAKNDKFEIGIRLNWDSNLSSSVIESIGPNYIKFEISPQVERCYRNIDVPKLSEYIGHTRKALAF